MDYTDEWIPVKDIEKFYDNVTTKKIQSIAYVAKKNDEDISKWYRSDEDRMVNVGYLKGIWKLRRAIQFECQDRFYEIITSKMTEVELVHAFAEYLDSSYNYAYEFVNTTLFANYYFTSLSTMTINGTLLKFQKFIKDI